MKVLLFVLILPGLLLGATYKGKVIDGKKFAANARIGGVIVPLTVRFDGKHVDVWRDGKIVTMKLASEVIDDPRAVAAYDNSNELLINVLELD